MTDPPTLAIVKPKEFGDGQEEGPKLVKVLVDLKQTLAFVETELIHEMNPLKVIQPNLSVSIESL